MECGERVQAPGTEAPGGDEADAENGGVVRLFEVTGEGGGTAPGTVLVMVPGAGGDPVGGEKDLGEAGMIEEIEDGREEIGMSGAEAASGFDEGGGSVRTGGFREGRLEEGEGFGDGAPASIGQRECDSPVRGMEAALIRGRKGFGFHEGS
jgi:hypothetical protein